jgi:hypothetical protein
MNCKNCWYAHVVNGKFYSCSYKQKEHDKKLFYIIKVLERENHMKLWFNGFMALTCQYYVSKDEFCRCSQTA